MIGNSYVMNLGEHIRAHFNYNYSDYRYIAISGKCKTFGKFGNLRKLGLKISKFLRILLWYLVKLDYYSLKILEIYQKKSAYLWKIWQKT